MSEALNVYLQPKQEQLFRLMRKAGPDVATNLGYGGARGGAKSGGAQRCGLALALLEPNIGVCIIRRLYGDLKDNHIDKMLETWPALRDYYRVAESLITLPNGSKIFFRYAQTKDELIKKSRGQEYKYIIVDQAEQFSEDELKRIKTTNRWPGTKQGECKMVYLFNPGGVGTDYLRRVFFLRQYQERERATDFAFIQAYGWDNFVWFTDLGLTQSQFYALENDARFELFINHTDYGQKMNALPESLRMGELLGRFDAFAGQYFAGVWQPEKVVLTVDQAERLIQPWWTRWASNDWGFSHNNVTLWFASGKVGPQEFYNTFKVMTDYPIDVVVCYREMIHQQRAESDIAQDIVDRSVGETIERFYMSPDAFAKKGEANTVAQQFDAIFERNRMPSCEHADNDRIGGWRLMYKGFQQSCECRNANVDRVLAERGPMFLVSANCPQTIGGIPLLMRDEDNLEDVLKVDTLSDDIGDSYRYGVKSHIAPRNRAPKEVRAREVFESHENPTDRHIAMLRFHEAEKKFSNVLRRRR